MRAWALLVFAAACYRAPSTTDPCAITCTTSCPGDLTCQGGFCAAPGSDGCHPAFGQVTAGTEFACALDDRQALWCWGSNAHFQISPGSEVQFPVKTLVDRAHAWTQIDAGSTHLCGIADGQLYCWGGNAMGEASSQIVGDVSAPTQVTFPGAPASWQAVSAGVEATCALGSDGVIYCWGANGSGQLGDGTQVPHAVPTRITDPHTDWTAVSIGQYHTCAISAADGVYCWGNNSRGQLGPEQMDGTDSGTPVRVSGDHATSIATASTTSCMTTSDQRLVCWGDNAAQQLGDPTPAVGDHTNALTVASSLTGWTEVSAGDVLLCALQGGEEYCWGLAHNGGLGDGLWQDVKFHHVDSGVSHVSVGFGVDLVGDTDRQDLELACAVAGADVRCWGLDRFGQLGQGLATMALAPTEVSGGGHEFSRVVSGGSHACGLEGGLVYCWGSDQLGETTGRAVGTGNAPCQPGTCDLAVPTAIGFAAGATTVAIGSRHTCSLIGANIQCWGDDAIGMLGGGDPNVHAPRDVTLAGSTWTSLPQVGGTGQCAYDQTGELYCWGTLIQNAPSPADEGELTGSQVFAAPCFLDALGRLLCTGDNTRGQYGNGTTGTLGVCTDGVCNEGETCTSCNADCNLAGTCEPAHLAALDRHYTALATTTSGATFCGVRMSDQVVECWGENARGETGGPAGASVTTPAALPLSGCTAVAMGASHGCAICGGTISCWGDNRLAQLGVGPPGPDVPPGPQTIALTLPGEPWTQLIAMDNATCAIGQVGHTYCWGTDDHGGLGNGAASANLPVVVQ